RFSCPHMRMLPLFGDSLEVRKSTPSAGIPRALRAVISPPRRGMTPQCGWRLGPEDRPESSRRIDAGIHLRLEQTHRLLAEPGQVFRTIAGPVPWIILAETDIPHPVQRALDPPMSAHPTPIRRRR